MAAAISSPKVAIMETKKRLYTYDATTGGVACASVGTECRNLLSEGLGDTPIKGAGFENSSSPAPGESFDSGVGPYEVAVSRKTATGDAVMQVCAQNAAGDLATIADLKHALLTQTLAAHQKLVRAPLEIVEVTPAYRGNALNQIPEKRDVLGDEVELKAVWERQQLGVNTLRVLNVPKPVAAAAPAAPASDAAAAAVEEQEAEEGKKAVAEAAPQPSTEPAAAATTTEATLDIFASPAPSAVMAAAPAPMSATKLLAAQLFASPAPAAAAASGSGNDLVSFQAMGGADWVTFDTPVKSA